MDVLVISAHPDDETFGCGGTLLAHRASGDSVYWLIITEPTKPMWTSAQITQEKREIAAVAKALGVKKYWCAGMAPAGLDALDRKSTRLNSSHIQKSRMPSSA